MYGPVSRTALSTHQPSLRYSYEFRYASILASIAAGSPGGTIAGRRSASGTGCGCAHGPGERNGIGTPPAGAAIAACAVSITVVATNPNVISVRRTASHPFRSSQLEGEPSAACDAERRAPFYSGNKTRVVPERSISSTRA